MDRYIRAPEGAPCRKHPRSGPVAWGRGRPPAAAGRRSSGIVWSRMLTCPKCGYVHPPAPECPRCGIVYAKWVERAAPDLVAVDVPPMDSAPRDWLASHREPAAADAATDDDSGSAATGRLLRHFLGVRDRVPVHHFWGHAAVWVVALLWGLWFVFLPMTTNRIGSSFMHRVNLVFHEAGHILFMPFGDFMTVLGGSLMQLLIPGVVAAAFLVRNRDPFGASVGVWWLGQSAKDLAPYINDARRQGLPLLGGVTGRDVPGYHDWHNLLMRTGLLAWDGTIARVVDIFGTALLLFAIAWGGLVLWREWQRRDTDAWIAP